MSHWIESSLFPLDWLPGHWQLTTSARVTGTQVFNWELGTHTQVLLTAQQSCYSLKHLTSYNHLIFFETCSLNLEDTILARLAGRPRNWLLSSHSHPLVRGQQTFKYKLHTLLSSLFFLILRCQSFSIHLHYNKLCTTRILKSFSISCQYWAEKMA